jgi:hypothetical protein
VGQIISRNVFSRILSASIIWCFASWGFYLNMYSESMFFGLISGLPQLSLNIAYAIKNSYITTSSYNGYVTSSYETVAFIISLTLCMTGVLVIGTIFSIVLNIIKPGRN